MSFPRPRIKAVGGEGEASSITTTKRWATVEPLAVATLTYDATE